MDELLALIIITPLVYLLWLWICWWTDMDTVRRRLREARSRSERRRAAINKFLSKFF